MTEQEQKDLDELKAKIQEIKVNRFDYMAAVLKYTDTDMLHSGYQRFTRPEAIAKILEDAKKRIDKLTKEYIRKYPDD